MEEFDLVHLNTLRLRILSETLFASLEAKRLKISCKSGILFKNAFKQADTEVTFTKRKLLYGKTSSRSLESVLSCFGSNLRRGFAGSELSGGFLALLHSGWVVPVSHHSSNC